MANYTTAELGATSMDLIRDVAQDVLIQEMILTPTLMNESARAGKGVKSIALPRTGRLAVNDKAENADVTFQTRSYSNDVIDLVRHKELSSIIEDRADIQAMIQEKMLFVKDAAKELALEMDEFVYTLLAQASAGAPDHRIAFANATSIGKADILEAQKLLRVQNIKDGLFLAVNPCEMKDMLSIDHFIRADHAGQSAILNGELGQVYGVKVLVSNAVTAGLPVMYHGSSVAWAAQMGPRVQSEYEVSKLGEQIVVDHLYGGTLLDLGKRQVLLGSAV